MHIQATIESSNLCFFLFFSPKIARKRIDAVDTELVPRGVRRKDARRHATARSLISREGKLNTFLFSRGRYISSCVYNSPVSTYILVERETNNCVHIYIHTPCCVPCEGRKFENEHEKRIADAACEYNIGFACISCSEAIGASFHTYVCESSCVNKCYFCGF